MAKLPEEKELVTAITDLRALNVLGVRNLRQAVLQQHPDWCVGEKRVKRINRLLNEYNGTYPLEFAEETRFCETTNEEECGWEDILCDNSVEKEWVLVDLPGDL